MLQEALGVPVEQHDDGSRPGMHDLDVLYPDRPRAVVEIVAAADQEAMALSRTRRERWQAEGLAGGWIVSILPAPGRWRRLVRELPTFLATLEQAGITELSRARLLSEPIEAATRLGIVAALQSGTNFPGSIYPQVEELPERRAGFRSETGNELPQWITRFLRDPAQQDVRDKLRRSEAAERHAFVVLPAFGTAPFGVFDLLTSDDGPCPTHAPDLPDEINHVWTASTWDAGTGFRWSPDTGWSTFSKAN